MADPKFAQDIAALRIGESVTVPMDGRTVRPSEFIIIEEPMGRTRVEMAEYIDFVAVIDTPLEIALCRRLQRDMDFFGMDNIPPAMKEQFTKSFDKLSGYLRTYFDWYLHTGRDFYIAIQEQAQATCDLVLDGQLRVDELAQQLVSAVRMVHMKREV